MALLDKTTGLAVFLGLSLFVVATVLVAVAPDAEAAPHPLYRSTTGLSTQDVGRGAPLTFADLAGAAPQWAHAEWDGGLVIVLKVSAASLAGSAAVHGDGVTAHALAVPGDPQSLLVAYSAKSTHLGCGVDFLPGLGGSREVADYDQDGVLDGRLVDVCHQSQWDVYDGGRVLPDVPAKEDLFALDLRTVDGALWAARVA